MIKLFLIEQLFCFMIDKKERLLEMRITELLDINSIDLNPQVSNKEEAINHLVDLLDQSGKLMIKKFIKKVF